MTFNFPNRLWYLGGNFSSVTIKQILMHWKIITQSAITCSKFGKYVQS